MKRHILSILFLAGLAVTATASAQSTAPQEEAPKSQAAYFNGGSLINECLMLDATEAFSLLSEKDQGAAVMVMLKTLDADRAVVKTAAGSTLWYKKNGLPVSVFLGKKGFNPEDYSFAQLDRLGSSRWFLTFGAQIGYRDSFSVGANARGGVYLLRDILDIGLGLNVDALLPKDGDDSVVLMLDLSSRFYFSKWMPRSRIIPYVGLGLGYSVDVAGSDNKSSFEPVISAGANWYLSKGSIDIGLQYGTERDFCFNVGYTITF